MPEGSLDYYFASPVYYSTETIYTETIYVLVSDITIQPNGQILLLESDGLIPYESASELSG